MGFQGVVNNYLPTDDVCVIYVGANPGQELEFFYEHFNSATIYCFEANPACISFLEITISDLKNGFPDKDIKVEVYNKAVCNNDNKILLYHNPESPFHQSATIMPLPPYETKTKHHKAKILTDAVRLDTFIEDNKINKIDLLYADVEGAQKELLSGATSALRKTDYLYIETQSLWAGPTRKQLIKMLEEHFIVEVKVDCDTLFKNINLKEDK